MQVVDVMLVMMVFRARLVVLVVKRAQLEDVAQRGEQEQHQFENEFLGRTNTDDERQHPHQLNLDQLHDEHDAQEGEQQFVAKEFFYGGTIRRYEI